MDGVSVKTAAKLSGLTTHTLRAWERRYKVIEPLRNETGRRLYSMADVEKLRLLALLIEAGHSIGNLAKLNTEELQNLLNLKPAKSTASLEPFPQSKNGTGQKLFNNYLQNLNSALRNLDFEELDRIILQARLDTPVRVFVLEIVSPLLAEVGTLVSHRQLDIAQEHALSAILRTHLGEVLSQVQKTSAWQSNNSEKLPRLLFSTPEGDLHEFGILLAAILAGTRGFKFRYLGTNMPAENLAKAAITVGAKIIVIGSVEADESRLAHPLKEYVQILQRKLSASSYQDIGVWIGGHCSFDLGKIKSKQILLHTHSLTDFDSKLEKIQLEGI